MNMDPLCLLHRAHCLSWTPLLLTRPTAAAFASTASGTIGRTRTGRLQVVVLPARGDLGGQNHSTWNPPDSPGRFHVGGRVYEVPASFPRHLRNEVLQNLAELYIRPFPQSISKVWPVKQPQTTRIQSQDLGTLLGKLPQKVACAY